MMTNCAMPLSRALARLSEHGVAVNGQRVTIMDKDRLRRLANPKPLIDGQDE